MNLEKGKNQSNESLDLIIAILVITVCGAFVLYHSLDLHSVWNKSKLESLQTIESSIDLDKGSDPLMPEIKNIEVESYEEHIYSKRKTQSKSAFISEKLKIDRPETVDLDSIEDDPEVNVIAEEDVRNESIVNSTAIEKRIKSEEVVMDENTANSNDELVFEIKKNEDKAVSKLESEKVKIQDTKNCQIIIGAFAKKSNVERLITSLKFGGYSSFTQPKNNLTIVGVNVVCDPVVSKSILSEIKILFNKDAILVQ